MLTVTQGNALVDSGDQSCKLGSGDSAHYRADPEHVITNASKKQLICFLVVSYK